MSWSVAENKKIDDLSSKLGEIHGDVKVVKKQGDDHDETLYAPGVGIKDRMVKVEMSQRALEDQRRACPARKSMETGNVTERRQMLINLGMLLCMLITLGVSFYLASNRPPAHTAACRMMTD